MKKNYIYALGAVGIMSLGLLGCGQSEIESGIKLSDGDVYAKIMQKITDLDGHIVRSGIEIDYSNIDSEVKSNKEEETSSKEKGEIKEFSRMQAAKDLLYFLSKIQNGVQEGYLNNSVIGGIETLSKEIDGIEDHSQIANIIFNLVLGGFSPKDMASIVLELLKPGNLNPSRHLVIHPSAISWQKGENEEAEEARRAVFSELNEVKSLLREREREISNLEEENRDSLTTIEKLEVELRALENKSLFFEQSLKESREMNTNLSRFLNGFAEGKKRSEEIEEKALEYKKRNEELQELVNRLTHKEEENSNKFNESSTFKSPSIE